MRRVAIVALLAVIAGAGLFTLRSSGVLGGKPLYATENGAIDGYDPVSYFAEGEARKGAVEHSLRWKGEEWRFVSAEHREAFEANPGKYAPEYGGYCAYGMSEGYLADIDPEAWTIVDGRLFLNFDKSIMENWRETKERRIPQADENWKKQ